MPRAERSHVVTLNSRELRSVCEIRERVAFHSAASEPERAENVVRESARLHFYSNLN